MHKEIADPHVSLVPPTILTVICCAKSISSLFTSLHPFDIDCLYRSNVCHPPTFIMKHVCMIAIQYVSHASIHNVETFMIILKCQMSTELGKQLAESYLSSYCSWVYCDNILRSIAIAIFYWIFKTQVTCWILRSYRGYPAKMAK